MNEANFRLKPQTGGLSYSVCTVVYIVMQLVFAVIVKAADLNADSDVYKYLGYLAAPAAISLGCFACMKYAKQKISDVAGVKCRPVYFLIALLLGFGLIFGVSYVNAGTLELLKLMGYTPRTDSSYVPALNGGLIVPALIVIAVIPAAVEEFFFRGVLLNNARAGMGDIRTVFTVGLCFSLFHASPEQTVYQFICGCAFALLTIRSGSLLPAMLIHFLNNAYIIVMYACGYSEQPFSAAVNITLAVLGVVAFLAGTVWLILIKKPFLKAQKKGVLAFFLFAAVGIFANALLWIFSFFAV